MARMKIKVANRLQGCSRALADLRPSCDEADLARLDEVIRRLDAVTAEAAAIMDGLVARPVQSTVALDDAPVPPRPQATHASAPQPVRRPVQTPAARAGIDPLDTPERIPEHSAFYVPHEDTSIEDPQTADDVRAAMAIPEDQRTEWQQIVVEDYQHLIEFEHVKPATSEILQCVLAVGRGGQVTPRQEWIALRFMNDMGWDEQREPDADDEAA